MDVDSRLIVKKVVLDVVCLAAVGFPILLFYLFGDPYKRGFFCSDESIRYPYHGSTVSNVALYIVGMGLPIIVMLITEYSLYRHAEGFRARNLLGRKIQVWIWNSYKAIGAFGFGAAASQLTTDIGKYSIGRLRPHFFAVCNPNITCSYPSNQPGYIENFSCRGSDLKLIRDSKLSFPSGHSSFSFYTMVYLAIYLQARVPWNKCRLWKHFAQFVVIMMAWGTALSRVSDYKHHFSDVIAGGCIGTLAALLTSYFVSDLFVPKKRFHPSDPSEVDLNFKSNNEMDRSATDTTYRTFGIRTPHRLGTEP
ncbi:unnamed protein product [Bemisia tabaci]|uniref:Phosphatidic acid phosphatase type 2/haloperoxidase domain-containing protein n=1 Tax=Bemisia tabaci TaxID=7038 RepID=A0A9P0A3U1_BEMTA|nr:unnamed protein product [Bemisia tabaci]